MSTLLVLMILTVNCVQAEIRDNISKESFSIEQAPIDIKKLFDEKKYYDITNLYAQKNKKNLTFNELLYISWSYNMLGEIDKAEEYNSLTIQKKPKSSTAYYIKGLINISDLNYDEALSSLQKAIELNKSIGEYYTEIGNIYLEKKEFDKAIEYYQQAIEAPTPSEQAYFMIADTYNEMGEYEKSIKAFRNARSHVKKDDELYASILYNIGIMEFDSKNYPKAISAFNELLGYSPDDYLSRTRIIQCYYALGDYQIGDLFKDKLYTAYQEGALVDSDFADRFCLDIFEVDSKTVSCYEYFQSTTDEEAPYVPIYIFYVTNEYGIIESEIQYSYLAETSLDKITRKPSYQLNAYKVEKAASAFINFENDMEYSKIKAIIKNAVTNGYQMKAAKFSIK